MDIAALTPPKHPFAAAATASVAIHVLAIVWIASALAPSWPRLPEPTAMPELVVTMAPPVAVADDAPHPDATAGVAAPMSAIAAPSPRDIAGPRAKRAHVAATLATVRPDTASPTLPRRPTEATLDPDVAPAIADAPPAQSQSREENTVAQGAATVKEGAVQAPAFDDRETSAGASPPGPPMPVAYREHPAPAYPDSARRRGEQGLAIVEALVGRDGAPVDVTLASSSGHAPLDAAAVAAVWHWRFVPATRDGVPIVARIRIPLRFRLTDDER